MIEFDPEKDRRNVAKHGISLARAGEIEVMGYARDHRKQSHGFACMASSTAYGSVSLIRSEKEPFAPSACVGRMKTRCSDMSRKQIEGVYPKGPVDDPENPEWTDDDVRDALPWDAMSDGEKAVFKRPRGRPPVEVPKKLVSLRLDAEVIQALEASGPGWRQRVNDILKAALKGDKAA